MDAPKRKMDWVGLICSTRREICTRAARIPAGHLVLVKRSQGGFEIEGRPCECCGVAARVRGIYEVDLRPVWRATSIEDRYSALYNDDVERAWESYRKHEEQTR